MGIVNVVDENLLESVFDNVSLLVAYLDVQFNFLWVNKAYADATDKSPKYFTGKNYFDLYPDVVDEAVFEKVIETENPYQAYATRFQRGFSQKTEAAYWDWSLLPVKDSEGSLCGVLLQLFDVTRHVRAETSLKKSQRFSDEVLRLAGELIVVLDRDGRIERFNSACEELTHYSEDEVKGRYVWDVFLLPEEIEPAKQLFRKISDNALPDRCTHYWVARDGEKHLISWSSTVVVSAEGHVEYIVALGSDVTEPRKIQLALEKSEARYRRYFNESSVSLWVEDFSRLKIALDALKMQGVVDLDAYLSNEPEFVVRAAGLVKVTDVNQAALDLYAAASKEQLLDSITETFTEESLKVFQQELVAIFEGRDHFQAEAVTRTLEGEENLVIVSFSIPTDAEDFKRVIVSVTDITKEKKARDALRLQAQMIDQVHDAIISTDLEGFVKSWNQGAERLFGYTSGEMLGRHISEVYPEEERKFLDDSIIAPLTEKGNHETEARMRRKSGEVFFAHLALSLLHDEDGNAIGMIGYSSDVTDRKNAEFALARYREELVEMVTERTQSLQRSLKKVKEENEQRIRAENALVMAKEKAELANKQKSQFISRMSHELRTPLNAILGFGQLLQSELSGESQLDLVMEVMGAGSHLLYLIDEVLELSTIESGNYPVVLKDVSLYAVVQESISLVKTQAEQSGVRLVVKLNPDADIFVRLDPGRLKEVISNLLTNAIKYNTENGWVSIETECLGKDRVRLLVRDTGAGLSEADQNNLFEPFERLGAEYTDVPGTGIGLTICRHLMDMMGGGIGVQSEPGKGSVFWLDCPLGSYPFADIDESMPVAETLADQSAYSLLYVEDNQANRRLVECIIAQYTSMNMTSAHTAEDGINVAREGQPDLIVLDINLPGMDGFEALEVLKAHERTKDIPVVALSAAASADDIAKGVKAGFKRYLTKPIDIHEFLRMVQEELGIS